MALAVFTEGPVIPNIAPSSFTAFLKETIIFASLSGKFHGNHPGNYLRISAKTYMETDYISPQNSTATRQTLADLKKQFYEMTKEHRSKNIDPS